MSKITKELDVTKLVQDIYCSEVLYEIKEVEDKVLEWLKKEGYSKEIFKNLPKEIYDLVLMLTEHKFDFNLVEKIVYESSKSFMECRIDFSLMLKDNSYWYIELVGVHSKIQQDYEEFQANIFNVLENNIYKDHIKISNNYNSYCKKPKKKGSENI